jgi:microcystin-dependent protein
MAEPFLSEIRIMSFSFAPKGWALCNGQLLPINQNQPLFALLGTTFGGDGRVNFALPDLRAKAPIHVGSGHTLGEQGGADTVTLNVQQMPQHTHLVAASSVAQGGNNVPTGRFLGGSADVYAPPSDPTKFTTLRAGTITNAGGSQPHTNDQPYTVLSFCIALQGIFPSPN